MERRESVASRDVLRREKPGGRFEKEEEETKKKAKRVERGTRKEPERCDRTAFSTRVGSSRGEYLLPDSERPCCPHT